MRALETQGEYKIRQCPQGHSKLSVSGQLKQKFLSRYCIFFAFMINRFHEMTTDKDVFLVRRMKYCIRDRDMRKIIEHCPICYSIIGDAKHRFNVLLKNLVAECQ